MVACVRVALCVRYGRCVRACPVLIMCNPDTPMCVLALSCFRLTQNVSKKAMGEWELIQEFTPNISLPVEHEDVFSAGLVFASAMVCIQRNRY